MEKRKKIQLNIEALEKIHMFNCYWCGAFIKYNPDVIFDIVKCKWCETEYSVMDKSNTE